jgi:hypothetical protein
MPIDLNTLSDDEVIELQEKLVLRSEFIAVTPEVEAEVRARLKTLPEDRKTAITWEDAKRRLEP